MTLYVDCTEHQRLITRATLEQMHRFQANRTGLDDVHPSAEFENTLRGKIGEAAMMLVFGLPVDGILDDGPGRPDLEWRGFKLDAKATRPSNDYIGVRNYYLRKPDLDDWVLMGFRVNTATFTAEVVGTLRAPRLHEFEAVAAATGHSEGYVRVPLGYWQPVNREALV